MCGTTQQISPADRPVPAALGVLSPENLLQRNCTFYTLNWRKKVWAFIYWTHKDPRSLHYAKVYNPKTRWLTVAVFCFLTVIYNWITSYFYTGLFNWFLLLRTTVKQPDDVCIDFKNWQWNKCYYFYLCPVFLGSGSVFEKCFMCHWFMVDVFHQNHV